MKKISLELGFKAIGFLDLNVPDNYEISSTNPKELWRDLMKIARDQIEVDLEEIDYEFKHGYRLFDYFLYHMFAERIPFIHIEGENGKMERIDLDNIPFNNDSTDRYNYLINI
jgi:hypothetical protein